MNAYMHPDTARALLARSREFTEAKRAARAESAALAEAMQVFARCGWSPSQSAELAQIHVRGVEG